MAGFQEKLRELVVQLHDIHALKFGDFKMKVGINSPVYFDLRVIISHPKVLELLAELLWEHAKSHVTYDNLCGVPYTALPIATLIAVKNNIPMLMRRKEAKSYGTKKLIEGKINKGDRCVIIEDVVTSGSSILETVQDLHNAGLHVTDAVVVVDRQQGATVNLQKKGINMHSLTTLPRIMDILFTEGRVEQSVVNSVKSYLQASQVMLKEEENNQKPDGSVQRLRMTFKQRVKHAENPVARTLFELIEEKKTTLCVAADVTKSSELINIATAVGKHICILKTHIDIIEDFSEDLIKKLLQLAQQEKFLILEDRKFADIGHTVSLQYSSGIHHIGDWADLVTVHALPGEGILEGLKVVEAKAHRGCFLVAQLSSKGNLIDQEYTAETTKFAENHRDFVSGFVSQSPLNASPGFVQLTPGVKLGATKDNLGQQYVTPRDAVIQRGADVVVVGRGITHSENPASTAILYKNELWNAYQERVIAN